jgi:hypothetical protein
MRRASRKLACSTSAEAAALAAGRVAQVLPIAQLPDELQQQQSLAQQQAAAAAAAAEAADGPAYPRVGRWQEVRYKGDWMRRPIGSNEISVLVGGWVSAVLLGPLGLLGLLGLLSWAEAGLPGWIRSYRVSQGLTARRAAWPLQVRLLVRLSDALNSATGLDQAPATECEEEPETVLQQAMLGARHRGWRVNLRPLAEVQTLGWLGLLLSLGWLIVSSLVS